MDNLQNEYRAILARATPMTLRSYFKDDPSAWWVCLGMFVFGTSALTFVLSYVASFFFALVLMALLCGGSITMGIISDIDRQDQKWLESAKDNAYADIKELCNGLGRDDFTHAHFCNLIKETFEYSELEGIRRRAFVNISALLHIHNQTLKNVRDGDYVTTTGQNKSKARGEVYKKSGAALISLYEKTKAEVDAMLETVTVNKDDAITIQQNAFDEILKAPSIAPKIRGNTLASIAKRALALDPDLTDAVGARIEPLGEDYLPRLLIRHEAATNEFGTNPKVENERLEIGLELISTSIEEGLNKLSSKASDELMTELRFLQLRRQGCH